MAEGGLQLSWMDYYERYLNLDSSSKKEVSDLKVLKPRKEILRLDFGFTLVTFVRLTFGPQKSFIGKRRNSEKTIFGLKCYRSFQPESLNYSSVWLEREMLFNFCPDLSSRPFSLAVQLILILKLKY